MLTVKLFRTGRPEWLSESESEQATLAAVIFKGLRSEVDGVCVGPGKPWRPGYWSNVAPILPEVSTRIMTPFLVEFSKTIALRMATSTGWRARPIPSLGRLFRASADTKALRSVLENEDADCLTRWFGRGLGLL